MPYIVVNVMGRVSNIGNGTFYVDGAGHYQVKNGHVIYVGEGYHSIKYRTTMKKTEWTASANFTHNTVMTANVIDEDFSSPDFRTHIADESELLELENMLKSQQIKSNIAEKAEKGKSMWYALRCIIGIAIVIAGLYVTFKFKQTGWEECILPAVLMGVGAGLIKSRYLEDAAKGFFGLGIAWFVIMFVFNMLGKFFGA